MSQSNLEDLTDTPLPLLAPRDAESHKGDFGRAVLVGGSLGMSGAISLAGKAALRSGAGLVTLAVPCVIQEVVASIEPSYMTFGLDDYSGQFDCVASRHVLKLSENATAMGLGPGLGRSKEVTRFVTRLYHEIAKPMVVDADALFALAEHLDEWPKCGAARILTPHPGEFAKLSGSLPKVNQRVKAAASFAKALVDGGCAENVIVLKGHETVVTDGKRYAINRTGNPGMATGGTGDVLTGIITALLCQGLSPFDAARLGVHVHGLAGDLAANELGQVSMIASDLIEYLPRAFRAVVG
jgi:ADP-dependent NAD(P)H-hydrate dehydratase